MIRKLIIIILLIPILACNNKDKSDHTTNFQMNKNNNLLEAMNEQNLHGFNWMNEPEEFQFYDGSMKIKTGEKTDFFNNPENNKITANAPFLYKELEGDFVATALVKPNFDDIWNACSILIHMDATHWIKLAFENSDATGKSIVTVVTNEISDDANGAILNENDTIWLRIIRKGNIYALHWSESSKDFKMARLAAMPAFENVKVGIETQCPAGAGAEHEILFFSVDQRAINDLRKGQ